MVQESRDSNRDWFFDHMLTLLAFHSEMDIKMICHGDLEVDSHHSVEDMGIALGKTILEALGDKRVLHVMDILQFLWMKH